MKSNQRDLLTKVRIASPCRVPFSEMTGDEKIRHCGQCKLNVYNVSEMTEADALRFIEANQGKSTMCKLLPTFRRNVAHKGLSDRAEAG